ncbi:MAG: DUF4382 domain-containing protein, partial [Gammaproteobacteria bacterium]|nr:DUF4382 domain-containing protein [Gammaproteobacteria bacterium]
GDQNNSNSTITNPDSKPLAKGTVGVILTDKPADASRFVAINATITAIELLGDDEQNGIDLTLNGNDTTLDLLRLKHEAIPFTVIDNVPVGRYCKIRLSLNDLELVLADDTPDDMTDNETAHPNLPGNGKLDLVIRGCFNLASEDVVALQIDIDAGNSIHVVENGHGFQFRPVVFVDVLDDQFTGKLIRTTGTLSSFDELTHTIQLCDVLTGNQNTNQVCVNMKLNENTAFFDNEIHNGTPRSLDELFFPETLNKTLTIVGWHHYASPSQKNIHVPPGHYPPAGLCRLWETGTPPGHQAHPINCDDIPSPLPANTIVVTHDGPVINIDPTLVTIDALAIQLGDFSKVEGHMSSAIESSEFTLDLTSSEPVIDTDSIQVVIQENENNINGTRIVSKTGELLTAAELNMVQHLQIDGVLESGDDPVLYASLIIVDMETPATNQVSGTIQSLDQGSFAISIDQSEVCGQAVVNPLAVNLPATTRLTTVTITETSSEIQPSGALQAGQKVGIDGLCSQGEYQAQNIVIIDDQRVF